MKSKLLATGLFLATFALPFSAIAQDFSAAYRVNSEVITHYEIDQMALMLEATGTNPENSQEKSIQFLINDRLIRVEAKRIGFNVEDNVVAQTLDRMAGGEGQGEGLRREFNDLGINDDTINTYASSQVMRRTYADIRGVGFNVSPEEITQRINNIPDQVTKTVKFSELVIPYAEYGGRIPARYEYKKILERLSKGQSFASIARELSRSPTSENGGALQEIPEPSLNEQLSQIVATTSPGKIAKPIETEGAMIIIRFNGYGELVQSLPRDPKVTLVDLFVSDASGLSASVTNARNIYADVQTCETAEAKIGQYPSSLKMDNVAVSSLSSGMSLAVARMEVGTRAIFERENGTSVIYLCDRQVTVPEEVSAAVQNNVRNEAIEGQMDGMLRELRAVANIVKVN